MTMRETSSQDNGQTTFTSPSQGQRVAETSDVVCGMELDSSGQATFPRSEYDGTTFFFCSKGCKLKFDESPEKFVESD